MVAGGDVLDVRAFASRHDRVRRQPDREQPLPGGGAAGGQARGGLCADAAGEAAGHRRAVPGGGYRPRDGGI